MRTQNSIKTLFSFIILIVLITFFTVTLLFIQRENDINESYNINILRAFTSPIVNIINEDFPNIDDNKLSSNLNELKITALISDLNNNILYNDSSINTNDISHELYQDNSYSLENQDMIKVSFTINDDTNIVGFVIFEIPKEELVDKNYDFLFIVIIFEVLLLIALIIYWINKYNKIILDPIKKLDNALLDISNGIYNKLSASKGFSIKSFTYYNIMLDEIENMLNNQANYAKSRKQLIANISHEIRTPLSYVKMSAEILEKDESISIENKKYIDTILNKITSIDNIIEDLFRYSKQDLEIKGNF